MLAFSNAQTLHYEGTRMTSAPTKQVYSRWNVGGLALVRVESSATVSGVFHSTTFIKDPAGIWDIWSDRAVEVSKIFTHDQLLGVYPFHRFFKTLQFPYELELSEEKVEGVDYFGVEGSLAVKPEGHAEDIAKEFGYLINKNTGLLYSIQEQTFGSRTLDLKLDKVELNQTLDPGAFEVPADLPTQVVSTMKEYENLKRLEARKLMERRQIKLEG